MITIITICSKILLSDKIAKCFTGIAFDGRQYYLSAKATNKITILNEDFEVIDCVSTRRPFTAISYDSKECCFWAVSAQSEAFLFKLDCRFREIDKIEICPDCECSGPLTSVSYCCTDDRLLISTMDCLFLFDKQNHSTELIKKSCGDGLFFGAACMSPLFFYISKMHSRYTLKLIDRCGGSTEEGCLPTNCIPQSALIAPCADTQGIHHIYLLVCVNGCFPYILDARLEECPNGKISEDDCDCNCGCNCNCEEINCILESIALQEASIAHILNAEGEKLQKAIADNACVCELLELNESVRKTIVHVTHLEHVLFAKLDTLNECCDFCRKTPAKPSKPCPPPYPTPCPTPCPCGDLTKVTPCEIDCGALEE